MQNVPDPVLAAPQTIFTKIDMHSELVGMARFELAACCSQSTPRPSPDVVWRRSLCR